MVGSTGETPRPLAFGIVSSRLPVDGSSTWIAPFLVTNRRSRRRSSRSTFVALGSSGSGISVYWPVAGSSLASLACGSVPA
jgi:hypothetical protein